ncbi:MAG: AAA family ATPase, partial [Thiohalospira sp.]
MTHGLTSIRVQNYKSFVDANLELSPFTPMVGYNNAGKSNALSAIQWLLKRSGLNEGDFFDTNKPVIVTAVIEGVTEQILNKMPARQRASIENLVFDGRITVSRKQDEPNLRASDVKILVLDERINDWVLNPNGIENSMKALLPEPIRIGAMEDAAEDAAKSKNTTTIGKLLSEFLRPVREAHQEELDTHLGEVSRRISSDGDLRLCELENIDNSVNAKIHDLFPGMSIKLHFDTPSLDDLIKSGTIRLCEGDDEGREFSSYGHGAQRATQMALVQYLAEM